MYPHRSPSVLSRSTSSSFLLFAFCFCELVRSAYRWASLADSSSMFITVVFSLQGKAIKFDTTESIEPYLVELNDLVDVNSIILSGNTLGIDASAAVGKALESKSKLTVSSLAHSRSHSLPFPTPDLQSFSRITRLPTSPTSSLVDSSLRFLWLSHHYALHSFTLPC